MGACIPEDENPDCYDLLHDMLRENLFQIWIKLGSLTTACTSSTEKNCIPL